MSIPIPTYALEGLLALEKGGYEARLVGGCVRDTLLGAVPHDYDLCTNASPEKIKACFPAHTLVLAGEKHGTVGVVFGHEVLEITTYRRETGYADGRHPDKVAFVSSLEEDLSRRDFTVNAMAMDKEGRLFDPFGGRRDLETRCIRAVGDPQKRFEEDALRILRGLRFAARLGFCIDAPTAEAMETCRSLLTAVSGERVYAELQGLLTAPYAGEILEKYGLVLAGAIPEIAPCLGFSHKNKYHRYDVWGHIAHAVALSKPVFPVRLALLLHDLGKPQAYRFIEGRGKFTGHPAISRRLAEEILERLHPDRETRGRVLFLVEHHDDVPPQTEKELGRFLLAYGEETLLQLFAVMEGDALAHSAYGIACKLQVLEPAKALYGRCKERGCAMSLGELAVSGRDLLALGMEPGEKVKEKLEELFLLQLTEGGVNEKSPLLKALK